MTQKTQNSRTTRREALRWAATATVTAGCAPACAALDTRPGGPPGQTVRERLWIWSHVAGAYGNTFGLPRTSRMTPAEGALYLGVPNLFFVHFGGKPAIPFDQYAIAFRPFDRVVWSLVGASGQSNEQERQYVLDLASRFPNVVGFIMDDYFSPKGSGALSVDQLRDLRRRLVIAGRMRDLHVVLYQHQLDLPIQPHLELCDKVTFWTWKAEQLKDLEPSFDRFEKLAPRHGKLLGCYLWDFGTSRPMPLEAFKKQCRLGLRWLQQGRIEGMIFLGSNVCDLGLDTVEWARHWIADVGSQPLTCT